MLKKGGDATHFSPSWELPTQQQKKPNLGARKLGSISPFVATPEMKFAIADSFEKAAEMSHNCFWYQSFPEIFLLKRGRGAAHFS